MGTGFNLPLITLFSWIFGHLICSLSVVQACSIYSLWRLQRGTLEILGQCGSFRSSVFWDSSGYSPSRVKAKVIFLGQQQSSFSFHLCGTPVFFHFLKYLFSSTLWCDERPKESCESGGQQRKWFLWCRVLCGPDVTSAKRSWFSISLLILLN